MAPGLEKHKILPWRVAAYNRELKKMDYFNSAKASDNEFMSDIEMRLIARTCEQPLHVYMVNKGGISLSTNTSAFNRISFIEFKIFNINYLWVNLKSNI